MAKRPRPPYSRWRRLPPVFRSGEHKLPGYEQELQRIIVYLPGSLLDVAEELADKAGVPTIQEYCAGLLAKFLGEEEVRHHLAEVEARRGPLKGLRQIAQDPAYLAEWQERAGNSEPVPNSSSGGDASIELGVVVPVDALTAFEPDGASEAQVAPEPVEMDSPPGLPEPTERPRIRLDRRAEPVPRIIEKVVPEVIDTMARDVLFAHAGPEESDPGAFLPSLRRGQAPTAARVAELIAALEATEREHRGAEVLDFPLAYVLYRLALESQVLLTDAWPGAFEGATINAIRAVQEGVERILSGQDVRFYRDHTRLRLEDQT